MVQQNGWEIVSVAQLDGDSAYQNSPSSTVNVTPMGIILSRLSGDGRGVTRSFLDLLTVGDLLVRVKETEVEVDEVVGRGRRRYLTSSGRVLS